MIIVFAMLEIDFLHHVASTRVANNNICYHGKDGSYGNDNCYALECTYAGP